MLHSQTTLLRWGVPAETEHLPRIFNKKLYATTHIVTFMTKTKGQKKR